MLTPDAVCQAALELPGAVTDHPFAEDFDSTALRHRGNQKWFGLLFYVPASRLGRGDSSIPILNLKCNPDEKFTLFEIYPDVIPAYHMNKTHWITVVLNGTITMEQLQPLLRRSFDLTAPNSTNRRRKNCS